METPNATSPTGPDTPPLASRRRQQPSRVDGTKTHPATINRNSDCSRIDASLDSNRFNTATGTCREKLRRPVVVMGPCDVGKPHARNAPASPMREGMACLSVASQRRCNRPGAARHRQQEKTHNTMLATPIHNRQNSAVIAQHRLCE